MPRTDLYFYQDKRGRAPVVEWLRGLRRTDRKGYAKCVAKIKRLGDTGHQLRRPDADLLRDGIYELRARRGRVNYRILYFFHGQNVAILAHALTKEEKVLETDIERVLQRKELFEDDPEKHTYEEEIGLT